MIKGRCLCEEVCFAVDPEGIVLFNNCYCKKCQRNSGTGFVSQIQVLRKRFAWVSGEHNIALFESSPGVNRSFCRTCGSRVPMTQIAGEFVPVPVGLLDEAPEAVPEVNMHVGAKAHWALVDTTIASLEDQGSAEFWEAFMARKQSSSPD